MKKYLINSLMMVVIFVSLLGMTAQVNASVVNPNEPCNGPTAASSTNQPCQSASGLVGLIHKLQDLLNAVIPMLVTLGVVYFIWGVVQYVIADGEEAKKKGKDGMIYGIIGLAVIISLWGLVYMLSSTFQTDGYVAPSGAELDRLLPKL